MKSSKTWILIADAGRSRVLERIGRKSDLAEVADMRSEHHVPLTSELVRDRQGRSMVSGGAYRHGFEPKTDPNREAKRHSMQHIAGLLDARLADGAFDEMVLVAPPKALGDLRFALSAAVSATVTAEFAKDLTKVPDHEILGHLE